MCRHGYRGIPTETCDCPAETYRHLHGVCRLCGHYRTFKYYEMGYGVAYSSEAEADSVSVKRLRGQQKMRQSIALGARPGVRWTHG
jgi:hypothetical protein